jgi:hypothetical protein
MMHMNSGAAGKVAVAAQHSAELVCLAVKTWGGIFIVASFALLTWQPATMTAAMFALVLMMTMATIAHSSVVTCDAPKTFDMKQQMIAALAPAQFSCLIWLAVNAGHTMLGASVVTSSLAALVALALIVCIDAVLSVAFLMVAEHGTGVAGVSVAALISSKYVGLLGKVT